MKICHLSYSDITGGAARAAYRIHCALRAHGADSTMLVNKATSGDWTVEGPKSKLLKAANVVRSNSAGVFRRVLKTSNPTLHSPSVVPSRWPRLLNNSDADVLNLHWVNAEMISIAGIGKIRKPVVWTLHDMWAFCGAEHYTDDLRWRDGYSHANRPDHEGGFDLNRWTWKRKSRHWRQPLHIVTSSRWLGDCARNSVLMRDWPVSVVPYALDTETWKPADRRTARRLLGLPLDVPLVLFGAMGGTNDPRKGFDLLQTALNHLAGQVFELELVIFGQRAQKNSPAPGFPAHFMGHLYDEISLRLLYSSADVMVVPSRQEAYGQTASEAHACGTPVVAFDVGGLRDIVVHMKTGYLAKPFDSVDLARGIQWVLEDEVRHSALSASARARAEKNWSNSIVAQQYLAVYAQALGR